jgi:uncharacterized repeat protein (TIGR03803 family)
MRTRLTHTPSASLLVLVLLAFAIAAGPAYAQSSIENVLYSFSAMNGDGALPRSGLIQDAAGNFYGTTYWGGNTTSGGYCPPAGCGTVFKVDIHGHETVLYQFTGTNGDGYAPEGGVVRDAAGNLYGTTTGGGDPFVLGGIIFKLDSNGNETVLYTFEDGDGNGGPTASLTLDNQGNLFGTTTDGGTNNRGAIFKLDVNGNYSELYSFTGGMDGGIPYHAGVLLDNEGNLYGVTSAGGVYGSGTIYKLTPTGQEIVLYSFTGGPDGANPLGTLVRDKTGNFYGVTNAGGANGNGVVYRFSTTGQQTALYTFGAGIDGEPVSGVVLDNFGNLYGTTTFGGLNHRGSVFKLAPNGTLTTLHSFSGGADGGRPYGGLGSLTLSARGVLYGTTIDGGAYSIGTVFEVLP